MEINCDGKTHGIKPSPEPADAAIPGGLGAADLPSSATELVAREGVSHSALDSEISGHVSECPC